MASFAAMDEEPQVDISSENPRATSTVYDWRGELSPKAVLKVI